MPPAEAASEPRDCLFSSWKVEAMRFGRVGGAKGFDAGVASVLGMLEVVEGYSFFSSFMDLRLGFSCRVGVCSGGTRAATSKLEPTALELIPVQNRMVFNRP